MEQPEGPRPAVALPDPESERARARWASPVPRLEGYLVVVRPLTRADASSLFATLSVDAVAKHLAPPPPSVEAFERFIVWAQLQQALGRVITLGVVPASGQDSVGIFQIRRAAADGSVAEWGFALGSEFWGSGLFADGAALVIGFCFSHLGLRRLDAYVACANARANLALAALGAVKAAVPVRCDLGRGEADAWRWSLEPAAWARVHPRPARPVAATRKSSRKTARRPRKAPAPAPEP